MENTRVAGMARVRRLLPRALRWQASRCLARRRSARLARDLRAMARSGDMIVAGPWLGEVGFELLYWVPFLAWFAEEFGVEPGRLFVVSRGGTASWYQPFAARYADVFDCVSPETFKVQHDARVSEIGEQKQTRVTAFERELLATIRDRAGIREFRLLHPSVMYDVLNPFWWGHLPIGWVHRHARYRKLIAPDAEGFPQLPVSYVATKFYFNDCFPSTAENRVFAEQSLTALSGRGEVVALSTGLNIDDHGGVRVDEHGVMHLPEGIGASHNLQLQSAVVARARAFVGTYGGFSYLAPLHGVPSVAYFSDESGFSRKHLEVARSALEAIGLRGLLQVHDTAQGMHALPAIGHQRG